MRGIRGKSVKTVKEGTLIATVDIGMTTNMGYCTTVDGMDIKPFRFENTEGGIREDLAYDRDKQEQVLLYRGHGRLRIARSLCSATRIKD
ncbi:MAG: hypothetical protein ACXU9F_08840 [Syntrophales bacterium]